MSETKERETLIDQIHQSVDRILANSQMSEDEKVRVFQEALRLMVNPEEKR